MQDSLLWVILMCFVPRLCTPLVACGVHRALRKANGKVRTAVAAAAGSLTNTVLYLGMMLLLYRLIGLDNPTLLTTVGTVALTAGLPEAAAAALIATPVLGALARAGLIEKK